jgi:hypothetical protein
VANKNLGNAKSAKNDEFYTQFSDIEKEMNAYLEYDENVFRDKTVLLPCDDPEWSNFTKYFAQNFKKLGLKKLISTSYARNRKPANVDPQLSLFEQESPQFDIDKSLQNGRIFILDRDTNGDGKTDVQDLTWDYLEGDGDFRSDELKALRNESDFVITNPPFSLFRKFLAWVVEGEKKFVLIGNMNAITYKETFELIQADRLWLGATANGSDMVFAVPPGSDIRQSDKEKAARLGYDGDYTRLGNSCWFTSIDHGRRHQPLSLMTENDNIKFSKHKEVNGAGYQMYDNYEAIEIPFTDSIPSDFVGVMGVPISFLSKYSPEQFEILGMCENHDLYGLKTKRYTSAECKEAYFSKFKKVGTYDLNASGVLNVNGQLEKVYQRILIKHRSRAK